MRFSRSAFSTTSLLLAALTTMVCSSTAGADAAAVMLTKLRCKVGS